MTGRKRLFICSPKGFSMLEVMIVVAIIGILASVAVANLNTMIPRSQTKSVVQQLRSDINKAKMEAVRNNRAALILFSTIEDGHRGSFTACLIDDVAVDECPENASDIIASLDLDGSEYRHVAITRAAFTEGALFRFNARGYPVKADGFPFSSGRADIDCISDDHYSFSIILSPSGRIRIN